MRLGIVASRFNDALASKLLERAQREAKKLGAQSSVVSVPGALEIPLALQWMAQSGHFDALVAGVRDRVSELQGLIVPHLDRDLARLSPVERSILYIGAFELVAHPETPFKVVLNEAIELGKSFGGTEGYRFVNGVLEKIAARLRPDEVGRARNPA